MSKKINKILNIILFIVIPYALVSAAIHYFGISMGIGVIILIGVALFLYFKAPIYTLIGRHKYFKDHDEGFKWLKKAYETGKMSPQQALIYAYLLLRDGHLNKAERLITSVVHQKKKELTEQNLLAADLNMAIVNWKKNDLKGAIEKMEEVYESGYRSTVHYATLGSFYIMNNQIERAEEFCKEAIEFNSSDASIRDNLGLLYIEKGDYEKAEDIYASLFADTEPSFIEAYYNYGRVLEQKGDFESAFSYYQKAAGCPEKYLSTVKLGQVNAALSRVEAQIRGNQI